MAPERLHPSRSACAVGLPVMTHLRSKTRRASVTAIGVAERLGPTAPPTVYVHKDKRPQGSDRYTVDGQSHRYDGKCHTACQNVR